METAATAPVDAAATAPDSIASAATADIAAVIATEVLAGPTETVVEKTEKINEIAAADQTIDTAAVPAEAEPEPAAPDAEEAETPEISADAEEPAPAAPDAEEPEAPEISADAESADSRVERSPAPAEPRARAAAAAIASAAILPIILIYHELVFRIATVGSFLRFALIPTVLFCVLYGLAGSLIAGLSRNPRVNRGIKIVLIGLTAVFFLVEFFVYKEFKVFYDVKTVTSGAGGVVSGFMDQVRDLIFSTGGILMIVLMILPLILYCVFGRKIDKAGRLGLKGVAGIVAAAVVAGGLNYAAINSVDIYKHSYTDRYSFPAAVENFGFLTGVRLDVTRNSSTRGATDYSSPEADDASDPGDGGTPVEFLHTPVSNVIKTAAQGKLVYDKNVLDIDFDALGSSAGGALQAMDNYVKAQEPSSQNEMTGLFEGKNLIFISAEAFSAEAIDPVRTPTLYRLATKGINFTDYYQPASAGTTGGEFENIFGMLPMSGGASFGEMTGNLCWYTMSWQLNMLGYYGIAYHNNDYMYYNRHMTHNKLGYSEGYFGVGNGLEGKITEQWPESDLEMMQATVDAYIDHEPFNVYYMSVSGHSGYSYGGNAMSRKNWDATEGYEGSETVRAYLACNIEFDKAMEYLLARLEEKGILDDTVIVISADHFPYGLDTNASLGNMPYLSELYGYNVENMMQRDHNRLIMWCGSLEEEEPIVVDTPTFSLDILPTLLNLYGIKFDSRVLVGRDVFSNRDALVFNLNHDWKTELGRYDAWTDSFYPEEGAGDIPSDYVSRMNTIVTNKINYCSDVITYDYYRHLFG